MGRNSKEWNVRSCPTWRQLTIQKSGTENEPSISGRTCEKAGVQRSAEKSDCASVNLKDQKLLHEQTSSHREKEREGEALDYERKIADGLHEWKNTSLLFPNKSDPNSSKHLQVKQLKIVLVDCMRSSTVEVRNSRISSNYCFEKFKICTSKNNGTVCNPTSKTYKKKIKPDHNKSTSEMTESDEHRSKDLDDEQPSLSGSESGRTHSTQSKPTFHVPKWRQLTKQQSGFVGGLTESNDFESCIESKKASSEAYRKNDSDSTVETGKRRQVQEELDGQDRTIIPTWRQLTKLHSGSLKSQSTPIYFEGCDQNRKSSVKKRKIRRQNPEGATAQNEITSQTITGSLHECAENNKPTSFREIRSDSSKSQVKSLKGYHKLDKKSTAEQDSVSAMQGTLSGSPKPLPSPCPELSAPSQNLMHSDEHGTKPESKPARSEPFSETLSGNSCEIKLGFRILLPKNLLCSINPLSIVLIIFIYLFRKVIYLLHPSFIQYLNFSSCAWRKASL